MSNRKVRISVTYAQTSTDIVRQPLSAMHSYSAVAPGLSYIEGIRSSGYIKASPCDSVLNILPSTMTCDNMLEWEGLCDFEDCNGDRTWSGVADMLTEGKALIAGVLRGTKDRIVVATTYEDTIHGFDGATGLDLCFFALPICLYKEGTNSSLIIRTHCAQTNMIIGCNFRLCYLECLMDKCDVEDFAAFLLINDLREIKFKKKIRKNAHGCRRTLQEIYARVAREWQHAFRREDVDARV
jgi:hypothetical protein